VREEAHRSSEAIETSFDGSKGVAVRELESTEGQLEGAKRGQKRGKHTDGLEGRW
jgi:hypothetical protein